MKKIGALLLSMSLFALTVGCGGDDATSTSSSTTPAPTTSENGDETADPEPAAEDGNG